MKEEGGNLESELSNTCKANKKKTKKNYTQDNNLMTDTPKGY